MERENVDRAAAESRVDANDRARVGYVQEAYGVDGRDPALYHLMIDAPAFGIEGCVDLIVAASEARAREADAQAP
jgi:cytidylate kinase